MQRVLIAPMTLAHVQGPHLDLLAEAGFEPVYPPEARQLQESELSACLQGIRAVLAGSEPYTPRVFAENPQLRIVARSGVGYDAVHLPSATAQGAVVTYSPNTNQEAVAEHTLAMILALAKNLIPHYLGVKGGSWPRAANLPLRGQTLGIAGLGRIGKAVALRAGAFAMNLLAYDPFADETFAQAQGITLVSFEQLLKESDYLTLHLPLNDQSRHLINRNTLARMKPTAFLVNTARGGLVHEGDLLDALRAGQLAGAALDVFEQEPPGLSPLFELPKVLATPHTAGQDLRSRADMALAAARAIVDLSQGRWPEEKVVNPEVRASFRW
jgi:D-3-phosphoglycerate dehydrogenase